MIVNADAIMGIGNNSANPFITLANATKLYLSGDEMQRFLSKVGAVMPPPRDEPQ